MANFLFGISSPVRDTVVGRTISVAGVARNAGSGYPRYVAASVGVIFGELASARIDAPIVGGAWTCVGTLHPLIRGGSNVEIKAFVEGFVENPGVPDDGQPFSESTRVVVRLDGDVPDVLTIDGFQTPVTAHTLPYHLDLAGSAADTHTGIQSVQLRVNDGPLVDVTNDSGNFSRWSKPVDLPLGQHHFTAVATDGAGNIRQVTADISLLQPFEPGPVDQVFEPTRYLLELLEFAETFVQVGDATALTRAMLSDRFRQPFDRLTQGPIYEPATRTVPQARIAVEVLRAHLGAPAPAELDQRLRGQAYTTLLRQIGTSYEELRLARTAEPPVKEALAARLGIDLQTDASRLDTLIIPPDTITDAQLEGLFGYLSTAPGDPLRAPPGDADLLLWRRAALRTQWQREDDAARDGAAGPLPIVEPDLVPDWHLRNQQPGDPAYDLWSARTSWIEGKRTEIEQVALTAADPLARFDGVVTAYLGVVDFMALSARDAEGEDITLDLLPLHLHLPAFRFLAQARSLLAAGVRLDTEWQDIIEILTQVQKRRQYLSWRREERERSLVLHPDSFRVEGDAVAGSGRLSRDAARWRTDGGTYAAWLQILAGRAARYAGVEGEYREAVESAERSTLPTLRDALIALLGQRQPAPEEPDAGAERLTRELLIDLRASGATRTTRLDQATETLQNVLFSARAGRLAADASGHVWTVGTQASDEQEFDKQWDWMGSYRGWWAAMRAFAYPDNQLFPSLYVADPLLPPPTAAYGPLLESLRGEGRLTPELAREYAATYLTGLRESGVPLEAQLQVSLNPDHQPFVITDQRSNRDLVALQQLSAEIFNIGAQHQREIFWLVPMALAASLQQAGHFRAALDWYQTVFAYHLPPANRKIYRGLPAEADIQSDYARRTDWLVAQLNPHVLARTRRNCYTRATVMAIVGCFLAYGDAEFSRGTGEARARARTLYEAASDLLAMPDVTPGAVGVSPFPSDPIWESLRQQAQSNLSKIHRGLSIAGVPAAELAGADRRGAFLPSQYRYAVLIERAKNLVALAQQVESAFLAALEQRDAKTYDELQARHSLQVAQSSLVLADLKATDANTAVRLAHLQREKALIQHDHYANQLREGLSGWEKTGLASMAVATYLQASAGVFFASSALSETAKAIVSFGIWGKPGEGVGQALSAFAGAASTFGHIAQTKAGYDRRTQDWRLQQGLAGKDVEIGTQQIQLAQNQRQIAVQERRLAGQQLDHAESVAQFLSTKFTNAELYEWMSRVLQGAYAYFLQQATALAQLAEAQLAFERQEFPPGFVGADYWRDTATIDAATGTSDSLDRRGLTGSVRLLQDIYRLDQYAFETDRRKLHVSHTLALSQFAANELQRFRDTGVLTFATPMEIFDRSFPGHYLRLIRRLRLSMVALTPQGVNATLSASGVSRVVVPHDSFTTVAIHRPPESIAFTSPLNATGLLEMEPDSGMLRPFEGMGVDTVWQLELPKPANPFDYRTIADVLLTIEYTALDSPDYRDRVTRTLDRRFTGDRSFSLRNQFPDAWYDLGNADLVEDPNRRMRAVLTLTAADFPPHIQDLAVTHLTLFAVRADELADELTVTALRRSALGGQTVEAGEVHTVGGVVGTRRPGGLPWQTFIGGPATGNWELQLEDTPIVRSWFSDGKIEDLVVVFTLSGTTPPWP